MSEASCSRFDSKADLTRLSLIFTEARGLFDEAFGAVYPTADAECGRDLPTLLEDIAQLVALRIPNFAPPLYAQPHARND